MTIIESDSPRGGNHPGTRSEEALDALHFAFYVTGTCDPKVTIAASLKAALPGSIRRDLIQVRDKAATIALRGDDVECPICGGSYRRFLTYNGRANAACPGCRSGERHRAMWLTLRDRTNFFTDQLRVLHVAPEVCFEQRFRTASNLDYLSGDLNSPIADIKLDLTAIDAPDGSFDVVICSHVLEHIPHDRQAMREIRRVLSPGGWALLVVPFDPARSSTYEDFTITSPAARHEAFGQFDHVRWYAGPDFEARVREAGFTTERVDPAEIPNADRYRLVGPRVDDWAVLCKPVDLG